MTPDEIQQLQAANEAKQSRIDELQAMWHREYMQRLKLEDHANALCGYLWEDFPHSSGELVKLIRTCGDVVAEGKNIVYQKAEDPTL